MVDHNCYAITMVAEDIAPISGGVPAVVNQLSQRLAGLGRSTRIIYSQGEKSDVPTGVRGCEYSPESFGVLRKWGFNRGLKAINFAGDNVVHIHGCWLAPQYYSAIAARAAGVPFVLSSHGMLEPWLWSGQGIITSIKKKLYWKYFARKSIGRASVVHAITPLERDNLIKIFGKNASYEVIQNAIDVHEYKSATTDYERRFVFLGRIDPKKGVDILLHAFAGAKISNDWFLDIIGPIWSVSYHQKLLNIIEEYDISDRVRILPPIFGEEKIRVIERAWVLVAPSFSEVVGLVNLESAALCVPSITTYETGLFDWESGGGVLIPPDVAQLRLAIEQSASWSFSERHSRGLASRDLILRRYSWDSVIPIWDDFYASLA